MNTTFLGLVAGVTEDAVTRVTVRACLWCNVQKMHHADEGDVNLFMMFDVRVKTSDTRLYLSELIFFEQRGQTTHHDADPNSPVRAAVKHSLAWSFLTRSSHCLLAVLCNTVQWEMPVSCHMWVMQVWVFLHIKMYYNGCQLVVSQGYGNL